MTLYVSGPPGNPLTRLLAGLVGVLALVGAVFFGLFVFAAAIGIGLVGWAVLSLRMWWIRRKLRAAGVRPQDPFGPAAGPGAGPDGRRDAIDAEYEVVSRESRED